MRQETTTAGQALTVSGNAASSASWPVKDRREKTVQIVGTFSGSVSIEGTIDGVTWASVAGPVSAPCILFVPESLLQMRLKGSGWTSGTATAHLSSFNARTD